MRYIIDCYTQDVHFTENCFFRSSHGKLPVRALLPIQMCITKFSLMCTPRPNPKPFSVLKAFTKHQKWQRSDKGSRVFIFYLCPRGLPEMINNLHQKCTGHTLEKHEGHMAKHTKLQISQCKVSCRGGLQNEDSRRYSTVNKNTSSSQIVVMGVNAKLGVLWKTLAKQHKQQQQ